MKKFAAYFVAAVMLITLGACISGHNETGEINDNIQTTVQTV